MTEWQPIETAPKEPLDLDQRGPRIMICGGFTSGDGPRVEVGHWKAARTNSWMSEKLGRCARKPTHWMPLPAPPQET